jgi:hypothetical protein
MPVTSSFPRIKANSLPTDLALNAFHDLTVENGDLAVVSGLAALPQKIQLCLSMQQGESLHSPGFGARVGEYFEAFQATPWVGRVLKLEVIRQSSTPYIDTTLKRRYTHFHCVDRVRNVEALADGPPDNRPAIRVELEVNGIGR